MPHYAHVLTLNRLEIQTHIGFYEAERNQKQPIEVSFRLYFPDAIACNTDDTAAFFNYATLAEVLQTCADSQKFNLIEYMAMELFRHLRKYLDENNGTDARLWLQLNKIKAPVTGLLGGASFVHSDLPADATYIPSVLL